ncbi:MAG: DMT family transporter [Nocardioides sp.]|uniref:DMT family transporter n=1 Tax=Nocardioides sp. TaxID=35761 RepID=UPI0039E5FF06
MPAADSSPRPDVHRTAGHGVVLVLLAATGWSLAGLFTRAIDASSWAIIGWRGVASTLAIACWLTATRTPRTPATRLSPPAKGGLKSAVSAGGLSLATLSTIATALYIPALQLTSVTNVVVVFATCPFVTAGLAWFLLREAPTRNTLIAAAGAAIGVTITAGGGFSSDSRRDLIGLLLAFGMTLSLAGVAVCGRKFRDVSQVPATGVSALQLAVLGLLLAQDRWLPAHDLAVLAVFGLVQAASLACYIEGARLLPASRTAVLSTADVPLAPLWVWLAFGEVPAWLSVLGGTVVLTSVIWDTASGNRRSRETVDADETASP